MSQKRQPPIFNPQGRPSAQLTTLADNFEDGYQVPDHFHREDQLVFASLGVMTIRTQQGIWVVPPLRAVWIPGGEVHSIAISGTVSMRTLYFTRRITKTLPKSCLVLNISPLLRELILFACERPEWKLRLPREKRTIEMLLDLLSSMTSIPLQLPQPKDPRAICVVNLLVEDPSDPRTLSQLCKKAGGSKRTIERAFLEETGMTFGKWRQQLRLLHGLRRLASGEAVTTAALDSGYNSTSAFISVFKQALGDTPMRYLGKHAGPG